MPATVHPQSATLDQFLVTIKTIGMKMLTVSKAKAGFSKVARTVIKTREPVVVRTPAGFVQIAPYDLPEEALEIPPGALKLTPRDIEMSNTWGETL
jgi:hypothetical protein